MSKDYEILFLCICNIWFWFPRVTKQCHALNCDVQMLEEHVNPTLIIPNMDFGQFRNMKLDGIVKHYEKNVVPIHTLEEKME